MVANMSQQGDLENGPTYERDVKHTATISSHGFDDIDKVAPASAMKDAEMTLAPTDSVISNPNGDRPAVFSSLLQEISFIIVCTFAVGMNSVLTGALITTTSFIGRDLNMTDAEVSWLVAGQTLASGTFLLFFGRVADLFGRRKLLVGSLGAFSIFMIIVGFSRTAIMAEVFVGLAGLCCAAAVPPSIGKLGATYAKPSRRKNRAFACYSAGAPVGFAIGAIGAGVCTTISNWRLVFWAMAFLFACFTLIAHFVCPPDTDQKAAETAGFNLATLKQFDFLGAFLASAGIGMFTASLTLGPDSPNGFKTPYILVLLILGLAMILAFIYWQSIFTHPLMPLHVWKDRNFSLLVITMCLGYYGFMANFFWLCLIWQRLYHNSTLLVAVKTLPGILGGITVNITAALIMHRVSNKLISIVSACALVVASALLCATSMHISYWALSFPAFVFSVIGMDFEYTITNMYVMSSLPSEQQSIAGGILNTVTRVSATVGLGVQTSVFVALGGKTATGSYNSMMGGDDGSEPEAYGPYRATFVISLVGAVLGVLFTPFLTLGTQGGRRKSEDKQISSLRRKVDV